MFKFILGVIVGIVAMSCLSKYRIVKVNDDISNHEVKVIDTKFIPDTWKSIVDNYWKEK